MIELRNLYKRFPLHAGLFARYGQYIYAVNGVSMSIRKNETYGLVGESGSGKTTIAKIIVGIYPFDHGELAIDNHPYRTTFSRPQSVQYIFQDPAKSLNPRQTIFQILTDSYRYHSPSVTKPHLRALAARQLTLVGLGDTDLYRRPIEFSGGQRQRIAIARALMHNPTVLICDEIVSALDVSIRAQIITLLLKLRRKFRMTVLFIAHDLSLVSYFCDRIGVLHKGVLVEEATSKRLLAHRYHPYTERLFRSIPTIEDGNGGSATTDGGATTTASTTTTASATASSSLTSAPLSWTRGMIPYPMREVAPGHRIVTEPL